MLTRPSSAPDANVPQIGHPLADFMIGPSAFTYLVYEGVFQGNTLLHHSNVRLSLRVERLLNTVLVTPRMHGIHHSVVEEEIPTRGVNHHGDR